MLVLDILRTYIVLDILRKFIVLDILRNYKVLNILPTYKVLDIFNMLCIYIRGKNDCSTPEIRMCQKFFHIGF